MRILLAAKYVPGCSREIGGVQTWVATVADELRRLGHNVTLWCPEWPRPSGRFDLGLLSNVGLTGSAITLCSRVLAISHGIIDPEKPPVGLPVVFTSEGVRSHWRGTGAVIRQPIDLQHWCPGSGPRDGMLRYSYRAGLSWLPAVAASLGMGFQHIRNAAPGSVRDAFRSASVVVASGRAALEAAACGAQVVICDHRNAYQGPLLDPDLDHAMRENYSGRGGVDATYESVHAALQALPGRPPALPHVQRHHDSRLVVRALLEAACSAS